MSAPELSFFAYYFFLFFLTVLRFPRSPSNDNLVEKTGFKKQHIESEFDLERFFATVKYFQISEGGVLSFQRLSSV